MTNECSVTIYSHLCCSKPIFHMWKTKGMSEQLSSQNGVDEHQGMANLTRTLSEDWIFSHYQMKIWPWKSWRMAMVTFHFMEKSSLDILLNISICVPQKKVSYAGFKRH